MLPSSTVENYLKAIYLGANALAPPNRLLPMGHLAAALGVTPGTATTMVKTLAESGLVEYEPYTGVALTKAGQKLAALVVRRHRVVEMFLVRVMGYGWDEVHEEAELLEHAVSDRLIDRMDQMLGRPEADPHGDPIPDPEGIVKPQPVQSLLTCPLHTPVTISRVIDQDKAFLRFIENHNLKPGESIEVEDRDAASDSVSVRRDDRRIIAADVLCPGRYFSAGSARAAGCGRRSGRDQPDLGSERRAGSGWLPGLAPRGGECHTAAGAAADRDADPRSALPRRDRDARHAIQLYRDRRRRARAAAEREH